MRSKLQEGLEYGDLRRLVKPHLQIDGFKSKMGDDDDIVVLCFTVAEKAPAEDLAKFLENSYEDVLDAETSTGELDNGSYLVFAEVSRDRRLPGLIVDLIEDLLNLTHQSMDDWTFSYYRDRTRHPLDEETLDEVIPLTPKEYRVRFEKKSRRAKSIDQVSQINDLKAAAGVPIAPAGPQAPDVQAMQAAAGMPIAPVASPAPDMRALQVAAGIPVAPPAPAAPIPPEAVPPV